MPLSPRAPVLEAAPDVVFRRPRLQSHERVGEGVVDLVVLRRKVVGLRLALAPDELGVRIVLMHVMRDRSHVVEELTEDVPPAFLRHDVGANQRVTRHVDGLLQLESLSRVETHITQTLVSGRPRPVVGVRRRGKPALVDAAAMRAERIEVIGMQAQPAARLHERARNPAGFEPENPVAGIDRVLHVSSSAPSDDRGR